MQSVRSWSHAVLLLPMLSLAAWGCTSSKADTQHQMPPAEVAVAHVLSKTIENFTDFTGRLEAVNSVELHPQVDGTVNAIHFTEGAHVKKGELLFEIDPRKFQRQVTRLEAEQRRAQSQVTLATSDRGRSERLTQSGAIAPVELEQMTAREAEAKAALDSSKASLSLARLDLDYASVRAPIDGRVSRALVTPGNLVSATTALTTLVSDGALYIYFDIDEATYLAISKGPKDAKTVKVGLSDEEGFPHEGSLDFLDNRIDPRTGTMRARAKLDNADGRLLPGLFARVRLVGGGSTQALLIDDKAVLTDQDRKYVFVVGEGNRAQRKTIVLGRIADGFRVVESGLDVNDRVVVHGVQKVFFPGAPLNPRDIEMGAPPPEPLAGGPAGH
jgi:multidrug efflux system membrane fusion protein